VLLLHGLASTGHSGTWSCPGSRDCRCSRWTSTGTATATARRGRTTARRSWATA
jgi:hypothetical protein